jgi:hypothetical protein
VEAAYFELAWLGFRILDDSEYVKYPETCTHTLILKSDILDLKFAERSPVIHVED